MSRHVTVTLTQAEAEAYWTAAGECVDHYDAMEATFPHHAQREAALRAHEKLADAWRPGYQARRARGRA